MAHELVLRITLIHPPRDVMFGVRRGKADLVPPTQITDQQISFDVPVRVDKSRPDGSPNLLGPFTHGPPAARCLYITSGTLAGQAESCWTRAAKVPLAGITWPLIQEALATPDAIIAAPIAGTAKDGGPACATVPLLDGRWHVVPQRSTDDAPEHPR
jgi:Family of unknown function (DUF5990)